MRFDTSHTHRLILSKGCAQHCSRHRCPAQHVVHLEVACNLDAAFFLATRAEYLRMPALTLHFLMAFVQDSRMTGS